LRRRRLSCITIRVGAFELEAVPRPGQIGAKAASDRVDYTVKKHPLDTHMVMEILDVPQPTDRAARMEMNRGAAMRRQVE
jgi:hypothetical protein